MAKDYAKRVFTTRKPKKKKIRIELLILFIVLLFLGIGFWFYKYSGTGNVAWLKSFSASRSPKPFMPKPKEATEDQAAVHFDFYNQLPAMEVKIPESGGNAPLKQQATPFGYIVQLGIFKQSAEASEMRLSLLLSGFEVDLVKIHSAEGEMYRLQKGPFNTLAEAKSMQYKLKNKGVLSEIKKD